MPTYEDLIKFVKLIIKGIQNLNDDECEFVQMIAETVKQVSVD